MGGGVSWDPLSTIATSLLGAGSTGAGLGEDVRSTTEGVLNRLNTGCLCSLLARVRSVAVDQSQFAEAFELGFHKAGQIARLKEASPETSPLPQLSPLWPWDSGI